ncbi:endonuclease NucS [Glycomyces luteolus]|uniref:Endonuclease NucS n=1 Tax=Glycomyces luteolus TaxID=2670330 RepID=A0A9X3PGM1_9ACTN|nr:endonuclease NucS domain-containing protein [Glycomyces luteolus]MDA1363113.1 endonuclease NucS [Glycomyces luteolus]
MTLEVGLWRADKHGLTRLSPSRVALESKLEEYIENDPTILGQPLLLIGRQVPTAHGGFIDLLAVDAEGVVHVLELKRDRTPRDVVAQTLDYGSWVAELSHAHIVELFEAYQPGIAFDEAFARHFGGEPPEELNAAQVFTVVAASVDPATERIVRFLNETFNVPINVVFFRHFEDDGTSYLARTWLVSGEAAPQNPSSGAQRALEPWNGRDWYVSFGVEDDGRSWEDARKYGFVSAGGGLWYSQKLKNLPIGARVFTCIPQTGYVGIGIVTGEAARFDVATVTVENQEQKLAGLALNGHYQHNPGGDDDDEAEYVVPVKWTKTVPTDQAIWKPGMFANQNPACRLRKQFTIETVSPSHPG